MNAMQSTVCLGTLPLPCIKTRLYRVKKRYVHGEDYVPFYAEELADYIFFTRSSVVPRVACNIGGSVK